MGTNGGNGKNGATGLVGAWRLCSFTVQRPDGRVLHPYGDDPRGLLIYDETGYMSAQLARKTPSDPPPSRSRNTERDVAARRYFSYFGRYVVDEARHVVQHHVESSFVRNWIGTVRERQFRLEGNRLTLEVVRGEDEPERARKVLVWERIHSPELA